WLRNVIFGSSCQCARNVPTSVMRREGSGSVWHAHTGPARATCHRTGARGVLAEARARPLRSPRRSRPRALSPPRGHPAPPRTHPTDPRARTTRKARAQQEHRGYDACMTEFGLPRDDEPFDFRRQAAVYGRFRRNYSAALYDAIEERTGPGAGRVAVDLGCGTGFVTDSLARRAWRVVGVDLSAPMLAAARAA